MEERTYLAIFVVLIALLLVIAAITLILLLTVPSASQTKSGFSGVNKNVSSIKTSTQNSINTTLSPLASNLSSAVKSITPTIANATSGLVKANSANISSAASGVNSNISTLGTTVSTGLAGINQEGKLENISITLNQSANILKQLNLSFQQATGLGWLKLPLKNYTISTANYIVEPLLTGFSNRVNYTASNTFNISVLTIAQYQNFTAGKSYSTVSFYQSGGSKNTTSFYFNKSEGCDQYIYLVQLFEQGQSPHNSNSNTIISANVSVKFQPSKVATGVC